MTIDRCSCKNTKCTRHGNCKECIEHHKGKEKVPYCKRPENIEASKKMKELSHIIW
ncbi:MAG: hypothetical protein ACRDD7_05560 [Peptostreptococcaceae bacterium]